MTLSSSPKPDEGSPTISLQTHDEAKLLVLRKQPVSPYNDDFRFQVEVGSPTVHGTGPFQISVRQLRHFVDEYEKSFEGELQDENGDGTIQFEKADALGHFKVVTRLGGPWSDQVQVAFGTDQTATTAFVEDLRYLLR